MIYSHLKEIDQRTSPLTEAWEALHTAKQKRMELNRVLHYLAGDHDRAVAAVEAATKGNVNTTIDTVQTRTLRRVVENMLRRE